MCAAPRKGRYDDKLNNAIIRINPFLCKIIDEIASRKLMVMPISKGVYEYATLV